VSLQLGPPAENLRRLPQGTVEDVEVEQTDFAETAALISQLDLVITVDTAVAHLAGGLGVPVWTMLMANPDWRWLADRDTTPWYPTMRLFRQGPDRSWDPVVRRIAALLREEESDPDLSA
jgi:ADP-heptose:LPS heptosyltransferase